MFITGPLLVNVPDVMMVPLLTKFNEFVKVPLLVSTLPMFVWIAPDDVITPVLVN